MAPSDAYDLVRSAMWLLFVVSAPPLIAALVSGFVISLFQALTQIQEATLTFVPKFFIVTVVILLSLPLMGSAFDSFMREVRDRIVEGS